MQLGINIWLVFKAVRAAGAMRAKAEVASLSWRDNPICAVRCLAMSAARKGRPGHRHSAEERAAAAEWMRRSHLEKPRSFSQDHRAKISKANKAIWASLNKAQRLERNKIPILAAHHANPSSLERTIWAVLDALGISYEKAKAFWPYTVDIYVEAKCLAIECDGEYWHKGREQRDVNKDEYLRSIGLSVLRLPERDIKNGTARLIVAKAVA